MTTRKTTAMGLWRTLETLPKPAAVLAEWRMLTGDEFDRARSFLCATERQSDTYPCTRLPACGRRHEIENSETGFNLRAVSRNDTVKCHPITLQPHDVLIYELDTAKLCATICTAMRFEPAAANGFNLSARSHSVGVRGLARTPVLLTMAHSEGLLLREVEALLAMVATPFMLLTPTATHCTVRVEGIVRRNFCTVIPLSSALELGGRGNLKLREPIDGVLTVFDQRVAAGPGLSKTVERIDRNIEAVAHNQYELRKENDELRQLNKDGYFNFALRVKGEDFLAFAVIMALGNRKAAADHLNIPHRTFYNRVDQWPQRGKDYQLMLRYMDWRKRSSRHLKVQLAPSVQTGESNDQAENPDTIADVIEEVKAADNKSYPALLAEVFQALQRQNAGNWMKVRQDLLETIKEDVMQ